MCFPLSAGHHRPNHQPIPQQESATQGREAAVGQGNKVFLVADSKNAFHKNTAPTADAHNNNTAGWSWDILAASNIWYSFTLENKPFKETLLECNNNDKTVLFILLQRYIFGIISSTMVGLFVVFSEQVELLCAFTKDVNIDSSMTNDHPCYALRIW